MKIIQYKVCLLGDFAVGKTSLVRRYVQGRFDDRYLSTIGVKVSRKSLDQEDIKYDLLIWDLAGGEPFIQYQNSYLSGALGAVLVFDLTRRSTLDHLAEHVKQVRHFSPEVSIVFVGNKLDLADKREISEEEIQKVSDFYKSPYFLTSAKTGEQVETIFQTVLGSIRLKQSPHVH